MTHTFSAGGVVRNAKGEICVVSQSGMSWSLPKGKLEPGEDELEAARREIFEEAGLSSLILIAKLGTYTRLKIKNTENEPDALKTITLFLFETDQLTLDPQDPKNPEARWVSKHEVATLLSHPDDQEFFKSIITRL